MFNFFKKQPKPTPKPLQSHTQHLTIHLKSGESFERALTFEDWRSGDWYFRVDIASKMYDWLAERHETGFIIEDVWYPATAIDRVELGKVDVEDLAE